MNSRQIDRAKYGKLIGVVGIAVNVFLAIFKFISGALASSISMMADAVNNLSDASSSVISLICFKISEKPADKKHPFGHARIEYFASMIVAFIIMLVGFSIFSDSIKKILNPTVTKFHLVSVIILAVSVICKLGLGAFNSRIAKKINSPIARATAADCFGDAVATSAVLLSQIILFFTDVDIDAYLGIAVAVLIFIQAIKTLNETKDLIIGEAPSNDICDKIRKVVAEYPEALGIHDLTVHNYGPDKVFASLHVEVDGQSDIFETHDVIDTIEKRIRDEFGYMCTIHLDPIVTNDEEVNRMRTRVFETINRVAPNVSMHDFRYVKGNTHTNLIFDIVVPFEEENPDQIAPTISSEIQKTLGENYFTVITVDRG